MLITNLFNFHGYGHYLLAVYGMAFFVFFGNVLAYRNRKKKLKQSLQAARDE